MKKGILLSMAASALIFAGGDIAPVEPAAPASADFWGQIGIRYEWNDVDNGFNFGDKENNKFSTAIVLGVEKQLGAGFGFGAEVAGWSDFGFDIADLPAVDPEFSGQTDQTDAEVSQAYLTYTFGNTAIKAGRQALPKAVSPWAWSDRSVGVIDISYDAIVIANTDLQDTTLVAAWVANAVNRDTNVHIGQGGQDINGVYMLAMVNKSLANTTLTATAYYLPEDILYGENMWSVWASAVGNVDGVNWGLQAAYVDADVSGLDATFGIAGKIGSSWGNFDATLVASYINDGDFSLKTAGTGAGTSAFWGNGFGGTFTNGDIAGVAGDVTAIRVDMGYKLPVGKLYGGIGYAWYDDDAASPVYEDGFGARIGYAFPVLNTGVNGRVEYRYADNYDNTRQRIRVEAYYKF